MISRFATALALSVALGAPAVLAQNNYVEPRVPAPLAERIAHTDPSTYNESDSVHGGAGPMKFTSMYDARGQRGARFDLGTNFLFLHRGEILPGGGIGSHFHDKVEEMFVILDGAAQFTVNSRTSELQGPAAAPARLGSNHAIYNHTDETIQWLNINVSLLPGLYDNFDLGDDRVGAQLDEIPQFITADLSGNRLRDIENYDGGTGTVKVRRALGPAVFSTAWSYFDHVVIGDDASIGPIAKPEMSEVFFVMEGEGEATINGETAAIGKGDAIPAGLGESRQFVSTGDEPLQLLVIGVARDLESKNKYMMSDDARIRR